MKKRSSHGTAWAPLQGASVGVSVRGYSLRSNPRLLSVDGFTVLLAAYKEECHQEECQRENVGGAAFLPHAKRNA